MKFVEVFCGQIVNIDEIAYLDHEWHDSGHISSYMYLKDGTRLEFLEIFREFTDLEGNIHPMNIAHLIDLHKISIRVIHNYFPYYTCCLTSQKLEENIWHIFMNEYFVNKEKPVIDKD